jgi:sterol desaturase/sphingolipid hydroxylase (fatty acid hydroxylase superfamily)
MILHPFMTSQATISAVVIGGAYLSMFVAETFRPLRKNVEPKMRRVVRNFTTGGVSLAILTLLQAPLLVPVAKWTSDHRFGLLHLAAFAEPVRLVLAIILMDYTLWWWHRANHQVPFLWRFHLPHHIDLDLDASTALRFHFGELSLSILYRAAQIVVIGVSIYEVWVWQTILFGSILFHHSNTRLPIAAERWLVRFIVTPRMHGIHHSDRENETNTNWASLFSCWDYLHRTILLNVPQEAVTIGVPAYPRPDDVTIGKVLLLSFMSQRDDWRDSAPRPHDLATRTTLMP